MRLTSLKYNLRVALCIFCVGLCSIGIYAQETQTDIDFLKQFQQGLEKGPIGEAIKVMKDSVGINVYPAFHIADDSALWPYVLELYFDVRAKRKEPYLLATLVLEPSTGKWTDFSKYSIRVTLTQGQQKAIPQTVLLSAEKHLNEILSNITNLKDYFTQIRDNIAETIQKLRFAMMDKYWEGRQLPLVSFYPGKDQQYGFDLPIPESIIGKYKNFYRYDSITRVPWKALSTTTPDKVNAYIQLRDTAFTKSHVRFVNRNSETVFPMQTEGDTLVFQLTGLSKENEDQITAEYFDTDPLGKERKASLGQVNTIAYENESNTVHIVPVGNAQYPGTKADLERYLNKVYKQAVVQWTVIFDDPIKVKDWDMDGDDTLNIETSLFSRYSDEEQAFVDVLEKQTNYDPKAAYLFVVDMANNMNARGYMPLSAQYGFIFTKVNQTALDEVYHNTVAHEAGHGVYKLQHPWDIYGTPKYQTNNLMDYQFGATLWKPQWDWIHDPGMRLYMFQKADEGAMSGGAVLQIVVRQLEAATMKVVWNRMEEKAIEKLGTQVVLRVLTNQALKEATLGTVIMHSAIWITAWELFTSTTSSSRDVAAEYDSYIKDYEGGYEDFWEMWVGPSRNFPLPPTVWGAELNQWLIDYWPEGKVLDVSKVQSHHILPNALLRGVNPNSCIRNTFKSNFSEYDKVWNRIDLPISVHNGSHPQYNKYMQRKFEEFLVDLKDIVKCGTPEMKSEIKKFVERMKKELEKNRKDNPGKTINEIYEKINQNMK